MAKGSSVIVAGGLHVLLLAGLAIGELSRGHQILLHRGLQVQADGPPNDNWTLWDQSNFTAYSYTALHPSRLWSKFAGYSSTGLTDNERARMDLLLSVKYKDEQDMTDPANIADAQAFLQGFRNAYPSIDVLLYTNQWGNQVNPAAIRNYMQQAQPDMLCFDSYPFSSIPPVGGSPVLFYPSLQMYRELGLAGNDGSGATPIPCGLYLGTFTNPNFYRAASDSEMRLQEFAAWAFGYKFAHAFVYRDYSNVRSTLFLDNGTTPTDAFYQLAETNRQSRNLGPTLVRLLSTDVRILPGRTTDATAFISSFDSSDNADLADHPDWTRAWTQGTSQARILSNQCKLTLSCTSGTACIGHRADGRPGIAKTINPCIGEGVRAAITVRQMSDSWTANSTNNASFVQWLIPAPVASDPRGVSGEKLALWAVYDRNGTASTGNSTVTLKLRRIKTTGEGSPLWTVTLPHMNIETTASGNRDIELAIDLRNRAGANVRAGYRLLAGDNGSVVQDWAWSDWFDLTVGAEAFASSWAVGWDDRTQCYIEAGAPSGSVGTVVVDDAYAGLAPIGWNSNVTPGYTRELDNSTHFVSTFDGGSWDYPYDNLSSHKDWTQAWMGNGGSAVLYRGVGEFWISSSTGDKCAGYRADAAPGSAKLFNPDSRHGLRFQVTVTNMSDAWTTQATQNACFVQYLSPCEISAPPQNVPGEKVALWAVYDRNGTTSTANSAVTVTLKKVKATGMGTALWSATLPHFPIETSGRLQLAVELRNTFGSNVRAGYRIIDNYTAPREWSYSDWFDLADDAAGEGFSPTWNTAWADQTRWYLEGSAPLGRLGVICVDDAVVSPSYDDMPGGVPRWTAGADPYITGIAAANLGTKNNGRQGDVLIGCFKPLIEADDGPEFTDERYFMLVNGLSDPDVTADCSATRQRLRVDFDFAGSGIQNLQRLRRDTGAVETVELVPDGGSRYHLDLDLDGGTGDLFKFDTGAPWVAARPFTGSDFSGQTGQAVASLAEWSDACAAAGTTRMLQNNTCKFYADGTQWLYSSIRADESEGLAMKFDPITALGQRFEHTVIRVNSTDPTCSLMHRAWLSPKPRANLGAWETHGERIILDAAWNNTTNDAAVRLRFAVNAAAGVSNTGAVACTLNPSVDLDAGDHLRLALEVRDGGGPDVRIAYKKYTAAGGAWSDWTTSDWFNPTSSAYGTNAFAADWKTRWTNNTYYYIEHNCRNDEATAYPTTVWIDDVTVRTSTPGDIDGDGHVTAADLMLLLAAMDSTAGSASWNPAADVDGDGEVTSTDLSVVLASLK